MSKADEAESGHSSVSNRLFPHDAGHGKPRPFPRGMLLMPLFVLAWSWWGMYYAYFYEIESFKGRATISIACGLIFLAGYMLGFKQASNADKHCT